MNPRVRATRIALQNRFIRPSKYFSRSPYSSKTLDKALTLFFNGSQNLYIDGLAWTATQTSTWLPLALVLIYLLIRNNNLLSFFSIVIALALCITIADQMASTVFKPMVARFRPTNNPEFMYAVDIVRGYRGGKYGFFSSHASNTMAVATFVSLLIRHKSLTFWLYSWAFLNCWTRVYLGVHYVGDLTVGTIWGLITGSFIYFLWSKFEKKYNADRLKFSATRTRLLTPTGYSFGSVHLLMSAVALTYIYIAIAALFFQG